MRSCVILVAIALSCVEGLIIVLTFRCTPHPSGGIGVVIVVGRRTRSWLRGIELAPRPRALACSARVDHP